MELIQLLEGDCLQLLPTIDTNKVDLVILDLPYGQTDCSWDSKIDLNNLWQQLKRVGKPTTAYIFFTTTKFGYELIKSNEKWFRYDLVWSKSSTSGFLNAKKMPLRSHEMIYVFYDKLPCYNIAEHHTRKHPASQPYSPYGMCNSVYQNSKAIIRTTGQQWFPKLPTSLLDYPTNKYRKRAYHPTEKPTELLEWIVKYYSREGDTVLDPTMGSGSVGVVCKKLKRFFIGIELTNEYFNVAKDRIALSDF